MNKCWRHEKLAKGDLWSNWSRDSSILLSICIPTFNRGKFIGETLASISAQINASIEIVIVDGASTDNTSDVVETFFDSIPNLVYFRGEKNMGVDCDLAKTVELANGEYCWFMSSDDLIAPNAMNKILSELRTGVDVYLFNRIDCTLDGRPTGEQRWLSKSAGDQRYQFKSSESLMRYINSVNTIGAIFSYIPCIVVNKMKWLGIKGTSQYFGTCYAHVYTLMSILQKGGGLKYVNAPIVMCRMENDSFSSNGVSGRFLIDYRGYMKIANGLFDDSLSKQAFLNVMIREHGFFRLLKLRSSITDRSKWAEVELMLNEYGYNKYIIIISNYLGGVTFLVKMAVLLNDYIKRKSVIIKFRKILSDLSQLKQS